MALGRVNTLREEVERLACDWRFSVRTRVLQEMYLKPVRLCRPSIQLVFGRHDGFWNASLHELSDWTSVVSKNIVSSRTGDKGDLGPESTWRATAMSVAGAHVENMRSPAEALRLASTVAADTLRVQNNTMDMRAQRLLAGELLRSHKAANQARDEALAAYFVDSVASVGRRCGPGACPNGLEGR